MPRPTQKPETRSRGNQVVYHLTTAARILLNVSDDDSNNPYLKGIAGISILILETMQVNESLCMQHVSYSQPQTVKSNKSQCFSMLDRIHGIITAIINVCGEGRVLPPTILRNLAQFFEYALVLWSYNS